MDNVRAKIYKILSDQLGLQEGDVKAESTAKTLGIDSLDTVELIMAIDEEFDIELDDEDLTKLNTVDDLVSYVETKIKK
ncbi:acyl carrier protein [Luteibacter flocculans]|uniref:Acyl carrier protein n=1 Tax=Luteibacter flocculans TaxID=2780091 RepID=A0ABY4T5C6_9GAMM|nr:acyl carrier protein [Luteibacter flocculans]URL58530.1 acyl carrier protein [Luteibacter flocculans]